MNPSELQILAQNKTRVLLFGLPASLLSIVYHILHFHGIETEIVTDTRRIATKSDFIILETAEHFLASKFQPNIVFLGSHSVPEDYRSLVENISQGGILIFPEFVEEADKAVLMTENYFRRMPYKPILHSFSGSQATLETSMGTIPVPFTGEEIFQDLQGAQFFAQQMGIMEDGFYDALSEFSY